MALYEQLEQNGKVMVGRILSNVKKFLSTTDDPQDVRFGTVQAERVLTLSSTLNFSIGETRDVFFVQRGNTYIATAKTSTGSGYTIALVTTHNTSDSIVVGHILRNSTGSGLDFLSGETTILRLENKTGANLTGVRLSLLRLR